MRETYQPPTTSSSGPPYDHTPEETALLPQSTEFDKTRQNSTKFNRNSCPPARAHARARGNSVCIIASPISFPLPPTSAPWPHSQRWPLPPLSFPRYSCHSRSHPRHSREGGNLSHQVASNWTHRLELPSHKPHADKSNETEMTGIPCTCEV